MLVVMCGRCGGFAGFGIGVGGAADSDGCALCAVHRGKFRDHIDREHGGGDSFVRMEHGWNGLAAVLRPGGSIRFL